MNKLIMAASNITVSELKSNRKYFSVSMRMFSTRANLNQCAVTEAFIDDIIANKGDYVCMPLCADVAKLKRKDYRGLTHMYDKSTGTFLADEIGSFYDYEKVSDEFGVSLIGYARINKRSKLVCEAIQELYDNNALNFSFEISAGVVTIENGISIVDANEENELTAMAVVSVPAYPESKALELVAEADDMNRFYANANMQISEVDIETVRRRFYELLYKTLDGCIYSFSMLLFCHDCAILYDYECGRTYKVEYMMENDDLIIKDFYEVQFVRAEGSEKEMEDVKKMSEAEVAEKNASQAQHEAEVETAENQAVEAEANVETAEDVESECKKQAEDTEAECKKKAEDAEAECKKQSECKKKAMDDESKDCEKDCEDDPEDDMDEMSALKKRCGELEAELEAMKKIKCELDAMKEAQVKAELDAKKDKLRKYAASEGLSVEDAVVAEAIENLNYEAIVAEVTANKDKAKEQKKDDSYFASYADIGVGGFSYLLKSR